MEPRQDVRGTGPDRAGFTFSRFPIPIYDATETSLYQLQELSRRNDRRPPAPDRALETILRPCL